MMIVFFLNILFLLSIFGLIYIIKRRVSNTGYVEIYSLLWFVLIIGSQFSGPIYSIKPITLFVLYGAWILFLIPSFFVQKNIKYTTVVFAPRKNKLKVVLFILVFTSLLVNIVSLYTLLGGVNFFKLGLIALRVEGRQLLDEQSTVFYQLFAKCFIIYIPLAMLGYKERIISKLTLLMVCFIGLFTCVVTLTRAPILSWAITILTSSSIYFKFSGKNYYLTIIYLVSPIVIVTLLVTGIDEELLNTVKLYLFGGVKAYETILNGDYPDKSFYDINLYSIDFISYIFKKIGLIERYPPLIREYTYIPHTNVYTYLDAATLDLGVAGVFFSAISFGAIAAYIHNKANATKDIVYVSYYCFINYAIAISFMNNELIRINGFILIFELLIIRMFIRTNHLKNDV
ncbi:oligosaccharide repeat unit polymerase [Larkinella punicea]|uniref:Oligosaccharide repeat unit polymerase n=1 Tax=Larkinella punicea TaxID=2315727 RepID=A0A368JL16_9BACT|nr:oligosaccharide repeat unit polymerase [Larkinella punicea]